jgi:hypothetical protein
MYMLPSPAGLHICLDPLFAPLQVISAITELTARADDGADSVTGFAAYCSQYSCYHL